MSPESLTRLQQLERWTLFRETDGFLNFAYSDSANHTLYCQHEIPFSRRIPDADGLDYDTSHTCGLPDDEDPSPGPVGPEVECRCDAGWIAEFQPSRLVGDDSTFPGTYHHYAIRAATFEQAVSDLYIHIALNIPCRECAGKGRASTSETTP